MSALTEKVPQEHYPYDDGVRGRKCSCDTRPPRYEELNAWHREHVAEVTEQAVRANVAAEIDPAGHHWSGAPALAFFALAADIREGKQP